MTQPPPNVPLPYPTASAEAPGAEAWLSARYEYEQWLPALPVQDADACAVFAVLAAIALVIT